MSDWDLEKTIQVFVDEGLTREEASWFLMRNLKDEKSPFARDSEKQQAATRAWHRIRKREDQERVG